MTPVAGATAAGAGRSGRERSGPRLVPERRVFYGLQPALRRAFTFRLPRRLRFPELRGRLPPGRPWKARWFQAPEPPQPQELRAADTWQRLSVSPAVRWGGEGSAPRRPQWDRGQECVPGPQAEEQAAGVRARTLRLQPGARVPRRRLPPRAFLRVRNLVSSRTLALPRPGPSPALSAGRGSCSGRLGAAVRSAPLLPGHLPSASAGCPGAQPRVTHV